MGDTPRIIAAFVRHGQYHQPEGMPSAHLPHPLTVDGHAQAASAAEALAAKAEEQGWAIAPVVDVSRLLRAWETGRDIIDALALRYRRPYRVQEFDALAERGVGAAANLTMAQIESVVETDPRYGALPEGWKSNSFFKLPFIGAESLLDAGQRVADHVEGRLSTLDGAVAEDTLKVFVGHGGAFRHAAFHLGVLTLDEVPALSMFHGVPVFLERLPDGRYTHVAGEWKVRRKVP